MYKNGKLFNPFSGELYYSWPVNCETIIPNEYRVDILTSEGMQVSIFENETGVYIREGKKIRKIGNTAFPLNLPTFKAYKYNEVLKVLRHEILINILDSKPLPNYLVYSIPGAAMQP